MPPHLQSVAAPDFADRLALTSRDRRLESMILVQLTTGTEGLGSPETSEPILDQVEERAIQQEARTYHHAASIAEFLAAQYAAVSLKQKAFVAELAAEVAQRIAEEMPRE
jgi:hypothetical protein